MKVKCLVLSLFIIVGFCANAQKKNKLKGGQYKSGKARYRSNTGSLKRNQTDIFPLDRNYRLSGWYASIGGTYMFPLNKGEGTDITTSTVQDTVKTFTNTTNATFEAKPKGKLGIYADIGYWKSFNNPGFFHFWEVGLSYRQYKGSEEFVGTATTTQRFDSLGNVGTSTNTTDYAFTNAYSDQAVSLVAKITRHKHISRYVFFQHSFGLNADYFLSGSLTAPVPPGFENIYIPEYHAEIQAQINYRFGVGWKAAPNLLIIPSIEVPLLTVYPFENGKSSLAYFSTRQYPIIFTIRAMLLRPLKQECRTPNYKGPSNFQ